MTYLQKKLIKKFLLALLGALILAWVNARPTPVEPVETLVLGKKFNEGFKLHTVSNDFLELKESESHKKIIKAVSNDSLFKFYKNKQIVKNVVGFDVEGVLGNNLILEANKKNQRSLKNLVIEVLKPDLSSKLISTKNEAAKVNFLHLISMLLVEADSQWNENRAWSKDCLKASKILIQFLGNRPLISTVESAAVLNCFYYKTVFEIINKNSASVEEIQYIVQICRDFPLKVKEENLFHIMEAIEKVEIISIMLKPELSKFSPNVINRLKTFGYDQKDVFEDLEERYDGALEQLSKKRDGFQEMFLLAEPIPAPASGAFSFITNDVKDKKALNNWLLKSISRFSMKFNINRYQNSLVVGENIDTFGTSLLEVYEINLKYKKIPTEMIDILKQAKGLSIEVSDKELVMKLEFLIDSQKGLFTKLPKSFKLKFPVKSVK